MDKKSLEFRTAVGYFSGALVGIGIFAAGGSILKVLPKIAPKAPEVVKDIVSGLTIGFGLGGALTTSDIVRAKYDNAVINLAKDIVKTKEAEQNA